MQARKRCYPCLPTSKASCPHGRSLQVPQVMEPWPSELTIGHWRHYVFAGESRFAVYCHYGRRLVHRRQGERLLDDCADETHGNRTASVMVWGAIRHGAKSELVLVDGTLNRFQYVDILRNSMVPYAGATFQNNWLFISDNATCHIARHTRGLNAQEHVEVTLCPVNSSDMNPIEHVWDQIGLYIRDKANPPINLIECFRLSNKPGILLHWKLSSTWSTACLVVWLRCRPRVVATLNIV